MSKKQGLLSVIRTSGGKTDPKGLEGSPQMTDHTHTYETLPDGTKSCFECGHTENRGGPRPGAGRPRTMGPTASVTVLLPQAQLETLQTLADSLGISRSEIIRKAVSYYVRISR